MLSSLTQTAQAVPASSCTEEQFTTITGVSCLNYRLIDELTGYSFWFLSATFPSLSCTAISILMHIQFIKREADFAMGHLDLALSKAVLGSLHRGIPLASSAGWRGGKQFHFVLVIS